MSNVPGDEESEGKGTRKPEIRELDNQDIRSRDRRIMEFRNKKIGVSRGRGSDKPGNHCPTREPEDPDI